MAATYVDYYIYNGTIDGQTPTETTSEYNKYNLASGSDYTIIANTPATGMAFKEWETDQTVTDPTSSTSTFRTTPMVSGYARATYHHAEKAYLDLDGLDVLATKVQKKITYGTEDLIPRSIRTTRGRVLFCV